jgi:hypothetical protein
MERELIKNLSRNACDKAESTGDRIGRKSNLSPALEANDATHA